jgi:antitoxin ParD1/3/4
MLVPFRTTSLLLFDKTNLEMSTVRKSITFTESLSSWMQSLVASGEYANESEYVRELVRKDRDKTAQLHEMRKAIADGLNSGVSGRSVADIMDSKEAQMRKDGQL